MTAATLTRRDECDHWLDRTQCGFCLGTWTDQPPISEVPEWVGLDADRIGSPPVLRSPLRVEPGPGPDPLDPDQEDDDGRS